MTSHNKKKLADWLAPLASRMRTDVSAIKVPDGSRWTKEPLDEDALMHHVNGGPYRGAAPIKPGESVTMVGLFDFDSHKGEVSWDDLIAVVRRVYDRLEELGYSPIPFRSSGGNGVHLYLVWDEPQDARSVRVAMREVLLHCELMDGAKGVAAHQVEVFPKQDSVGEGEHGNQFILPLANKSVPLEPLLEFEPLERDDALRVEWTASKPVPVLDAPPEGSGHGVQQMVNKAELHDIEAAVEAIPNSGDDELDYFEWRNLVFAIHAGTGGSARGLELAHELSAKSSKYDKAFLDKRTWRYIKPVGKREKTVSVQTLFAHARRYGWTEHVAFEPLPALIDAETGEEIPDRPALKLERDKLGRPEPVASNLEHVLGRPDLVGCRLGFDEFKGAPMVSFDGVAWAPLTDTDYMNIKLRLERDMKFKPIGRELLRDVVRYVCSKGAFDSAIQWINGLTWDGVSRVESFLKTYFGCDDTPYTRAASRYMWTALAGRCLVPGIKADMAVILVGSQGKGKSSAVAAMAPDEEAHVEISFHDQEDATLRRIRGRLVAEIGELRGLHTKDLESIKSFMTRQIDTWVPKYVEFSTSYKRRCVFVGTTNQKHFLADSTGNRRWLPVTVTDDQIDVDGVKSDRNQLWAEAAELFKANGIEWKNVSELAGNEHEKHSMVDAWEEIISNWLETEIFKDSLRPDDWYYIDPRTVAADALKTEWARFSPYDQKRLTTAMEKLGYTRTERRVNGAKKKGFFKTDVAGVAVSSPPVSP